MRAGIDSQWKYDLGSCDSTVERSEDGTEILITKTIEYGGDNSGKTLSSARIFLDDAATTTIKFCCRFKATHTAGSDEIEIENPELINGKLETEGSWKESLSVSKHIKYYIINFILYYEFYNVFMTMKFILFETLK